MFVPLRTKTLNTWLNVANLEVDKADLPETHFIVIEWMYVFLPLFDPCVHLKSRQRLLSPAHWKDVVPRSYPRKDLVKNPFRPNGNPSSDLYPPQSILPGPSTMVTYEISEENTHIIIWLTYIHFMNVT